MNKNTLLTWLKIWFRCFLRPVSQQIALCILSTAVFVPSWILLQRVRILKCARSKYSLCWLILAAFRSLILSEGKGSTRRSLLCFRLPSLHWGERKTFPLKHYPPFMISSLSISLTLRKLTQMDCMSLDRCHSISELNQDSLTTSGNTSNTHWLSTMNPSLSRLACRVYATLLPIMDLIWVKRYHCWWNTW